MLSPEGKLSRKVLGLDPEQSQQPRILVPAGTWFGASMEGGGVCPGGLYVRTLFSVRPL